ncbi:MAG: hypothetical protein OEV91_01660 [Desulfobulbaceae bacterium]|nr:hypothetical protein [Desulfobulbaceae bacterium]
MPCRPFLPALLISLLSCLWLPIPAAAGPGLTIGAGPEPGQQLLAELTALLLNKEGINAAIRQATSVSDLPSQLRSGEIDLCFVPMAAGQEPADLALAPMPPLPFAAGPVLLMRQQQARELAIRTVSDLAATIDNTPAPFRFGGIAGDPAARLAAAYDLHPAGIGNEYPPDLLYLAVKSDRLDVAMGVADDGRIVAYRLAVLVDDRQALPTVAMVPLTRAALLAGRSEITALLARLTDHLDQEAMQRLHSAVVVAHRRPRPVAEEWLRRIGLL